MKNGEFLSAPWGNTLVQTGLVASMVVNALMTGMIVFKILTVFLNVKPTSVERTLALGSLSSTRGPMWNYRAQMVTVADGHRWPESFGHYFYFLLVTWLPDC